MLSMLMETQIWCPPVPVGCAEGQISKRIMTSGSIFTCALGVGEFSNKKWLCLPSVEGCPSSPCSETKKFIIFLSFCLFPGTVTEGNCTHVPPRTPLATTNYYFLPASGSLVVNDIATPAWSQMSKRRQQPE